ncbi:BT_3928 family protein [Mongoliitalea daihaiensis]|uniref:BT_3928 family protein n=1 Tax=Mongoliitalea daihaiensis TaxID=2782006 RepID=UPI001F255C51|nr:BT_3928 family protein [Mongoliitalea daihaiensis]UJP63295.1 DoxX family protein [Mongoliitalea daihaiensis]
MLKNLAIFIVRFFVGGVFIFSGLIKVNDPVGTAIKLEEYFDVFSNDIASFFFVFKDIALPLAVFIVVLEVVLGVMLITGTRLRWTLYTLLGLTVFFTFLTFYSAYFNKVTDCGCFGDAIKLTPWESFAKDVVLLVLLGFLFIFKKDLGNDSPAWASWTTRVSLVVSLLLAIIAIRNLPFIDFRAYKEGVNITDAMLPSAPLQYEYVMTKDGDEFIFDTYPMEDGYEFVEMRLINEEALPKITDFAIWNSQGDFTEEILSGNQALILISNVRKLNLDNLRKMKDLIQELSESPIQVSVVAASSQEEIDAMMAQLNWTIPTYLGDATVIKTIMRSNPGIMLLKDGVVLKKYHFRNTPTGFDAKSLFVQ